MRRNVARSMFAMSLNMPDPHADVPGTTKIYDAGHPCYITLKRRFLEKHFNSNIDDSFLQHFNSNIDDSFLNYLNANIDDSYACPCNVFIYILE